jgi:hypothetical protein
MGRYHTRASPLSGAKLWKSSLSIIFGVLFGGLGRPQVMQHLVGVGPHHARPPLSSVLYVLGWVRRTPESSPAEATANEPSLRKARGSQGLVNG